MRVVSVVTIAIFSFIVLTILGCKPAWPKAEAAEPLPPGVGCVDGWQVLPVNGTWLYRHEHDVQEHLISCKEVSNG